MENVKDSIDISVARCSDGNISCKIASVRTCNASSLHAATNPPSVISTATPVCSIKTPHKTSTDVITNTQRYRNFLHCKISLAPRIPPISIMNKAIPSAESGIPVCGSFACKKNSNTISTAPTKELHVIRNTARFDSFRKRRLSTKQPLSSFHTDCNTACFRSAPV